MPVMTRGAEERISAEIAALFAKVFGVGGVAPEDDFFRLGGDSLLAESLILSVEEKFGSPLSVSTLLDAPTPRALARLVLRDMHIAYERDNCLVAIRPEGSGPPLFSIHGMNGNITYGQSLKTVFGAERPVYAIRAQGLLPGEPLATSVEACAADYIRQIRRVRRRGPYLLLAPCGPSIIAYEMAQQLAAAEERVPGLVMADPAVSQNHIWLQQTGLARALTQTRMANQAAAVAPPGPGATPVERSNAVSAALGAAIQAYTPAPYRAGVVLLLYSGEWGAMLMDQKRGFPALVRDLRAVEVSDTHLALQNDFRGKPASAVRAFLQDVAPIETPA